MVILRFQSAGKTKHDYSLKLYPSYNVVLMFSPVAPRLDPRLETLEDLEKTFTVLRIELLSFVEILFQDLLLFFWGNTFTQRTLATTLLSEIF